MAAGPFVAALQDKELLVLPGVDHYTFLGECGWAGRLVLGEICRESEEVPRRQALDLVGEDAIHFFDQALRGGEAAPSD